MFPLTGEDDRPYPVGYDKVTWLPARDGVGHGGVMRSGRAPNCSFFTNWTKKEDSITWDIEVLTPGDYEVDFYYTCAASDVGSTVLVSFGGKQLTGTIRVAHDPPLEGKEHDRVDRGQESYVKAFKPLRIGTMRLEKGRGLVALTATQIPGKQVADVRYLILTRA
jgi:hypothetical protein